MRLRWFPLALAMLLAAALLVGGLPRAGAGDHDDKRHDAVRRAVEAGEIRPLADIIAGVRDKLPGEIAGVEIERKNDRWLYEFRVIDARGRLFEVYIDARDGTIERIKEK